MAWNPNSTQGWKDPGLKGKYDQYYQQPQAQTNVYGGQYKDPGFFDASKKASGWGDNFLGKGSRMADEMQGWIKNPYGIMGAWGAEGWSPGHRDMAPGMAELRGGTRNMLDAGVKQMAGAGITASRGGFRDPNNLTPEASAQHAMIKQLAGQYGNDYMGIAGLINDAARNRGSILGSALGAGATNIGNLLRTGTDQGQLALGNLSALQSGQEGWNRSKLGEQQWNAQNYNQAMSAAQQQEMARQQQLQQQHSQQDQQMKIQQQWDSMIKRLNQNPGGFGQGDEAQLDLLGVQMGAAQPWTKNLQVQKKAF